MSVLLCVNIDHIATLRQARGGVEPDPIEGARICEQSGADGITVHLREDRRHIQDRDIVELKKLVKGKYNLEMSLSEEIVEIAKKIAPDQITIVPEKREELTTEGGLDVIAVKERLRKIVKSFHDINVIISLFIEPEIDIIKESKETGADFIEIHTGRYCNAAGENKIQHELNMIYRGAEFAKKIGIRVNAGHGLNYENVQSILKTPGLEELNIGHSIISRSVFTGIGNAVSDMVKIIKCHCEEP